MSAKFRLFFCVSAFCILHSPFLSAQTPYYYKSRTFIPVVINLGGVPTLAELNAAADKLTDTVPGTIKLNTNANETCAIEKQTGIAIGYDSPEDARDAVVAYNGTPSNYPGKTFDNVGWVRGTKSVNGKWGAYLWVLQNKITFQASTSAWWLTTNGIPVAISNVMVGSLGDYQATSNVVDIGPVIPSNFPGANQSDSGTYQVDISNVFYQLSIPDIWITPRDAVVAVGGSNVQFMVTGTNIPKGVTWTIIPSGVGATIQTNSDWHYASVTPGNVATTYMIRATSEDNTNFYDQVNLTVIKVDLEELTFSGSKYHTVKSDDGATDYTGPHWQDPNRDGDASDGHSYPVCFTRNTKMKVSGKWHVEPANPGGTIKIKGDGPGNLDFPETTATISGNDVTLTDVECSNPVVNEVDFFDPMPIDWKVSCDSGSTWCNAGTSTNQCYVTLGDPLTTVYQTLAHLGCKNADGQSTDDVTADSIYTEFTDREVHRVFDNKQMTYWAQGNDDPGAIETSEILQRPDANGNCQAWSALFRDFLRVQGITADRIWATPISPDAGILVKNWKFGRHVRTGANGLCDTDEVGDDVAVFAKSNGLPNTICTQAGTNLITTAAGDDVIAGNNINTGPDGICNTAKAGNDVQIITVGNGVPNTVCITSGTNGVINSTLAGDDVLDGNIILIGPDGICQTTAAGDDVQVIIVGNGQPNAVCINAGVNLVTASAGDDAINGAEITTGPNGKCDTTKAGNDIQVIPVGQGQPDTPCIGPGPDGTLNSAKQGDDTEQDGVFAGTAYPYWFGFDAADQVGIPGQGNTNPLGAFTCHYITLYNNQYYDPSYGTQKVTGTDKDKVYEDGSLDGFGTVGGTCRTNDVSPSMPSELNYQTNN